MIRHILFLLLCSVTCFYSCDSGVLKLTEETVEIGFLESELLIPSTTTSSTPLVLKGNIGLTTQEYWVYISVDDPNEWLENIYSITNPIVEAADHVNGKHNVIYKALVKKGNLVCALMIKPEAHPEANIEREFSVTILPDPVQAKQYNGLDFYKVNEAKKTTKVKLTTE